MRERLPAITALFFLAALVAGTWWAAYYTHSTVELDPPRRETHEPDSWATDFVMLRTDENGIAINRLEGDKMLHYPDDDSYHLDQARITVNQDQNPLTTATSDVAIMDQGGARVQMIGDAYIHRQPDQDGAIFTIRSEQLTIYPDQDQIQTDDPAVVVNGSHTLKGIGMRYDNNTQQLQVLQDAHVTMTPTNSSSAVTPTP